MIRYAATVFLLLFSSAAHATDVKEVKTANGITAWLVEEHSVPLVAVKISFRNSGYAYDPTGKHGRANMTAAMLNEGAGDLDSNAFNQALEALAIRMNSAVDDDSFNVMLESLSEHSDKAFYYLGLVLTHPRFDESSIDRTRRQMLSVLAQQQQQPGYQLSRRWKEVAYGKHPYANEQIGTEGSLNELTDYDMRDFMKRYLTKDNIIIAVVGDITPDQLRTLLELNLGNLPDKATPDVVVPELTIPAVASPEVVNFNIPQTMLGFGTPGLKRNDPQYFAAFVMNQILGGSTLSSKLGTEIREKRGLSYSVYSYLNPMQHSATWNGGLATKNEKAGEALQVLRKTLADFVANGPTQQELSDAKEYLTGSLVLNLDSNANIANFLISMQLNHLGIDYLKHRNKMVEAVTREDVHAVAKRLINPDSMVVVMVGKPALNVNKE